MLRNSGNTLIINIKASRLLGGLLLASHAGAGTVLVLIELPSGLLLAGWLLLVLSLTSTMRMQVTRRHPKAVQALRLDASGNCQLRRTQEPVWHPVKLCAHTLLPFAVLLTLRSARRRRWWRVLIMVDAVDRPLFRRLRAQLSLHAVAG